MDRKKVRNAVLRELEVARGLDSGKIDESQTRCKDIPCDDSYEDGRKL